jgi:myo-inositol-hexaphosphate 3-phosphohydrolase
MTPVPSIIVAVAEFSALALFAGSAPTDAATVAAAVTSVVSLDETDPVAASGDAADDPAIWVDESNPARSLVLGNNKQGALESYDLSGNRVQRITTGVTFYGNVDVRGNTIAVAHQGVQIFTMNASTRTMLPATEGTAINTTGRRRGRSVRLHSHPSRWTCSAVRAARSRCRWPAHRSSGA